MGKHTFPPGYTEGARVTHSADQLTATDVAFALAFDTENYDTDTIHDNFVNNSRLTCRTAGKYVITGGIRWTGNATGYRFLQVVHNVAGGIASEIDNNVSAITDYQKISTIWDMSVGDYVELVVTQSSGGNLNCDARAPYAPVFSMQRIG